MTTTLIETVPASWDEARDVPFFHLVERLFSPEFCYGAGVLLASYDAEPAADVRTFPEPAGSAVPVGSELSPQP
jgi:hypothetical protein